MRKLLILLFTSATIFTGCVEEAFEEGGISSSPQAPSGLKYASVVNAREYAVLISAPPTYNAYGAVPLFEIVAVRDENGATLPQDTIDTYFSILNYSIDTVKVDAEYAYINAQGDSITQYPVVDMNDIGRIRIEGGNSLAEGNYFFDINMSTTFEEQSFETTFENVFELYMGPQLVSGLVYIPGGQNLLTSGGSNTTTKPLLFNANPDYRFELADNQDKFSIDASTEVITLNSGYVPASEPEIVSPTINWISNISQEVVSFTDVINIYISNDPVVIPKLTVNVFYPTLEAQNTAYGYSIHAVNQGDDAMIWANLAADAATGSDRPSENANQKKLELNLVRPSPSAQVPHESWAIMNSQDLSAYQLGFDVEAEFFTKNQYVEYLSVDGTSPIELEVYISTDYMGNFANATWTDISDDLVSIIEVSGEFPEGNEFSGLPYPGDQNLRDFPNPDDRKDPAKNADGKYVRSTFDLVDYLGESNVTFAFRVYTTFSGTLSYAFPFDRTGRYMLADFNITAYEQ